MRGRLELGQHEDGEVARGVVRGVTALAVGMIALGMAGTAYAEQPDRSEWDDRSDARPGGDDTDRSQEATQGRSPDSTSQEPSTDDVAEQPVESSSQESDDSYNELLNIASQVVASSNVNGMTSVWGSEDSERNNPTAQPEETNGQAAEEDSSQPEEAKVFEPEHEEQSQDQPEVDKTPGTAETKAPSNDQTEERGEEKALASDDATPSRSSDKGNKDNSQDSRRDDSSKDEKDERNSSDKSSSLNENPSEEQPETPDVESKDTSAPVKDGERDQDVTPVEESKKEITKEESKPESEPEVKKPTTREHEEKVEKSKAFKSDLAGMADQSIATVVGSSEEQPWGDYNASDTEAEPEEAAPARQAKEEDQAEPSTEMRPESESEVDDSIDELAKMAGQVIVVGSPNSVTAASSQEPKGAGSESSSELQDGSQQADSPSADDKKEEAPAEDSAVNSGEDEEKEGSLDDIAGMADESIIVGGVPGPESDDEEAEQDPNDIRSWADQSIESGSGDEENPSDDGDKTESEGETEESSEEEAPEPKEEPAEEPAEEKAPEPSAKPEEAPKKSVSEIADEVLEDKWGVDEDREKRLTEAGYDYDEVQAEVNKKVKERETKKIEEAGGNPLDLPISTGSAPSYSNMDRPIQSNLKSKYDNVSGKLNSGELATVQAPWRDKGMNEWKLQPDAAKAFEAMNAEFKARTGESLCVAQTYRSYQGQLDAKARHGRGAATPGYSNHGWGLAIDFCNPKNPNGQVTRDNDFYKVLEEIGPKYGWVNPHRYDPRFQEFHNTSKKIDEPWHFEYVEKVYPDYYKK